MGQTSEKEKKFYIGRQMSLQIGTYHNFTPTVQWVSVLFFWLPVCVLLHLLWARFVRFPKNREESVLGSLPETSLVQASPVALFLYTTGTLLNFVPLHPSEKRSTSDILLSGDPAMDWHPVQGK